MKKGMGLDQNWYTGPTSDQLLSPQHDRTVLALDMSPSGDSVVTASADHGLRVYSMKTGKQLRQLYNKRYGHTDWVTTCAYLTDGRVLSASMDKRLCLWDKSIVKCSDLQGHNGSISKVKVDDRNIAISGSYDSSLLVWNLDTLECC
jgi:WD40 repeat protein